MPLRLLVILALLLGHWAPAALAAAHDRARCVRSACCAIEVVRTCCGDAVTTHRCARSGDGACRCGLRSGDDAPATPTATADAGARLLLLPSDAAAIAPAAPIAHDGPALAHDELGVAIAPPARRRARLCVWRT